MSPRSATATVISGPWHAKDHAPPSPRGAERRAPATPDPQLLRAGLTPAQLMTLEALEIFHWRLAFVRRPLFQPPIPVLFDRDDTRFVIIREDGTLDETPTLVLRA